MVRCLLQVLGALCLIATGRPFSVVWCRDEKFRLLSSKSVEPALSSCRRLSMVTGQTRSGNVLLGVCSCPGSRSAALTTVVYHMERPIARRQAFRWASFSAIPRAEVGRLLAPLDEPGRGSNGPAHRSCRFSDLPNAKNLAGEYFRAGDVVDARAALGVPFGFEANRSVGLRTPLSGRSSRTGKRVNGQASSRWTVRAAMAFALGCHSGEMLPLGPDH